MEVQNLLCMQIGYLTPTTLWLLQQDTFWLVKSQMSVRLKASFTVFDSFDSKVGDLNDFACCLKSPFGLSDAWLKAVTKTREQLSWKEVKTKYLDALISIKLPAQVLQVASLHLPEWPETLFGKQPLNSRLALADCYAELRNANNHLSEHLPEEMAASSQSFLHATAPILLQN